MSDMTMHNTRTSTYDQAAGRTLIRWSAVFAGTALGLGALVLLTSLWLALAQASEVEFIARNMEWFLGGSAVVCLFLAGMLAGFLSGVRGSGTGFLHGATIWALLLLVSLSIGIPAILNVFDLGTIAQQTTDASTSPIAYNTLWGSFWTILGGLLAAGVGGAIGGLLTRDDDVVRVDDEAVVHGSHVRDEDGDRTVVR